MTTGGRDFSDFGRIDVLGRIDVDIALADALDAVAEFGDEKLGSVLVDRLRERDWHAHLEECFYEIGTALGHAVGELLDGDCFRNNDIADLLGRRAGLHVMSLFLLAGAAERGQRASAAIVLVRQGPSDGELAAMALGVAAATARARGLGTARGRSVTTWTACRSFLFLITRGSGGSWFRLGLGGAIGFLFGANTSVLGSRLLCLAVLFGAASLFLALLNARVLRAGVLLRAKPDAIPRPREGGGSAFPCAR